MILLKKLQINNFLSYEDAEIEFPEDAQISIEGVSGSGKSSIVDAIIWAFFGKGRSENRNLIRTGEKSCSVTLELVDGKTNYKLERTATAAKQSITISTSVDGGEYLPIQRTGLKDHQDWIEKELLHSSYTLFINSIAYPQENADSFVKQTAGRRKDLLLEIARAEDYDVFYNRSREKSQLLSDSLIRDRATMESQIRSVLEASPLANDLDDLLVRKDAWDGLLRAKKGALETKKEQINGYKAIAVEKNTIEATIEYHDSTIVQCQGWIEARQKKIQALRGIDINAINEKLKNLEILLGELVALEEVERYNSTLQTKINAIILGKPVEYDHDKNIDALNKQLIEVLSHENAPCPDGKHCQCFGASFKKIAAEIEALLDSAMRDRRMQATAMVEYRERLESAGKPRGDGNTYAKTLETKKLISALAPFQQAKNDYESQAGMIEDLNKEIAKIESDILSIQKDRAIKVAEFKNISEKIATMDISSLGADFDAKELEVRYAEKEKEDLAMTIAMATMAKETMKKAEAIIEDLKKKIAKDEEDLDCITLVKDAFGSKGIKTIMIDYLIPRLEDTINDVLGQLSDFRVKLDTQKKAIDGESVIDGLFITIFNEQGEELAFENYSGGQKLKISVAISEALASIQKVGFRIFDETFIGLDESSTDSFATVMASLQEKFSQILCISHLRMIQDRFHDKIIVSKQGNKSTIT